MDRRCSFIGSLKVTTSVTFCGGGEKTAPLVIELETTCGAPCRS